MVDPELNREECPDSYSGWGELTAVVDNDVVKKGVCYGLEALLWPPQAGRVPIGILGAARYVVAGAIRRLNLRGDQAQALSALSSFAAIAQELEPSDHEVGIAAEMEEVAQRANLALGSGESQLAAIAVMRGIPEFHTGDKRAIAAMELTLKMLSDLSVLAGRVYCLEQLLLRLLDAAEDESAIIASVCAEPHVDRSLSICFGCYSGGAIASTAREGLASYITVLRRSAPQLLAA